MTKGVKAKSECCPQFGVRRHDAAFWGEAPTHRKSGVMPPHSKRCACKSGHYRQTRSSSCSDPPMGSAEHHRPGRFFNKFSAGIDKPPARRRFPTYAMLRQPPPKPSDQKHGPARSGDSRKLAARLRPAGAAPFALRPPVDSQPDGRRGRGAGSLCALLAPRGQAQPGQPGAAFRRGPLGRAGPVAQGKPPPAPRTGRLRRRIAPRRGRLRSSIRSKPPTTFANWNSPCATCPPNSARCSSCGFGAN